MKQKFITDTFNQPATGFAGSGIPIQLGRQLFVDDFLIEETSLARVFHHPRKHPGNPVFRPESHLEKTTGINPSATPKGGGVWRDCRDGLFKMWYEAGWLHAMALAVSRDGVCWERPDWGVVPGTNRILPGYQPDSNTVWIDETPGEEQRRYKMFFREPDRTPATPDVRFSPNAVLMTSPDGIHWSDPVIAGPCGDRSTCYFDPFRSKWVFSLRASDGRGRHRVYWDADDFLSASWKSGQPHEWLSADSLDLPGYCPPQLYNFDAVAYESLMLGIFEIHTGPTNEVCEKEGLPKQTALHLGFSRDGVHWDRPDRRPFIAGVPAEGSWEYGYVQSAGGVCLVGRDEIRFYYSAFAGDRNRRGLDWKHNGMYAHGATGLAMLRRDGFVSMESIGKAGGLTTRPVLFSGDALWMNASASGGRVTVECLDESGKPVQGFSAAECIPFDGDDTSVQIRWKSRENIAVIRGRPVRFRFHVDRGALYSFWVTSDPQGSSGGYLGAGSAD